MNREYILQQPITDVLTHYNDEDFNFLYEHTKPFMRENCEFVLSNIHNPNPPDFGKFMMNVFVDEMTDITIDYFENITNKKLTDTTRNHIRELVEGVSKKSYSRVRPAYGMVTRRYLNPNKFSLLITDVLIRTFILVLQDNKI
tara:strand:+ start:3027 stop:3455 length:429 start_codon:yes stop_codon:yes gene_type:complete